MSSQFDAAGVVGSLGREHAEGDEHPEQLLRAPASSVEEELAPASSVEEEHDVHMGGDDALTDQEEGTPHERLEEAIERVDDERRREGVVSVAAVRQLCDAYYAVQDEQEELRELRTQLSVAQAHVASMAAEIAAQAAEIAAQAALRAAGDGASKRTPAAEAKASTEGPPVEAAAPLHTPRPGLGQEGELIVATLMRMHEGTVAGLMDLLRGQLERGHWGGVEAPRETWFNNYQGFTSPEHPWNVSYPPLRRGGFVATPEASKGGAGAASPELDEECPRGLVEPAEATAVPQERLGEAGVVDKEEGKCKLTRGEEEVAQCRGSPSQGSGHVTFGATTRDAYSAAAKAQFQERAATRAAVLAAKAQVMEDDVVTVANLPPPCPTYAPPSRATIRKRAQRQRKKEREAVSAVGAAEHPSEGGFGMYGLLAGNPDSDDSSDSSSDTDMDSGGDDDEPAVGEAGADGRTGGVAAVGTAGAEDATESGKLAGGQAGSSPSDAMVVSGKTLFDWFADTGASPLSEQLSGMVALEAAAAVPGRA